MIVKGGARGGPRQLAVYLMRVERYNTGEQSELLEFRSPWAAGDNGTRERVAEKLIEAFRDWQDLAEATKQGRDGLYRCEISPAPEYAKQMTREQWLRAADIIEEELGFKGQDRVVVRHGGTTDRPHLHVVWQRTDLDTMKIIPDSFNFAAHERASKRMELEFGHEFVPGKHAKRDRELQPEFPRQDYDYAEALISKRSELTPEERKAQIAALKLGAANGLEFKQALEEAGYILAQGERGYLVVDQAGVYSVLSRNIGLKKAETEAFMSDVPLSSLPPVERAQEMQKEKALAAQPPAPVEEKPPSAAMTDAERKAQISALREKSDNAPAFRNALEEAGYVLTKGPRTGFYIIDADGEVFNLSRLSGISGKEYKSFMAGIDTLSVPDVAQGKALQEQRQAARAEAAAEAEKQAPPPSKFLPPELAEKVGQPPPEPPKTQERPPVDFDYYSPERIAEREALQSKFLTPVAPPQKAPEVQPPPSPVPVEQPRPPIPVPQPEPKRKPVDPDVSAQLVALKVWSDGAQDFKERLAEAGYTLAQGKDGYLVVNQRGEDFDLARHIPDKKIRLEAFMSPIALSDLPTLEQVREAQQQRGKWVPPPPIAGTPAGWAPENQELYDLERALLRRQEEKMAKLAELHERQLRDKEVELDREIVEKMRDYKKIQDDQTEAFKNARKEYHTTAEGIMERLQNRFDPVTAALRAQEREKEFQNFYRRLGKERADYEVLLHQIKQEQIDTLHERQRYERVRAEQKYEEDKERHIREYHEAKRIEAELEARRIHEEIEQKEHDKKQGLRDGPPPPKFGR